MSVLRRSFPSQDVPADWLPPSERIVADRRRYPRALLSLPVHLRWPGIFGLESDTSETLDVGRGGLLVPLREPHPEGAMIWTTFPFDAGAPAAEPETPSCVAWLKTTLAGGCLAGIAFADLRAQSRLRNISPASEKQLTRAASVPGERRRCPRLPMAFLIRICGDDPSWPEDVMTADISATGLAFCTLRVYEVGDRLTITFPRTAVFPNRMRPARVVRIAGHESDSRLICAGVEFLS